MEPSTQPTPNTEQPAPVVQVEPQPAVTPPAKKGLPTWAKVLIGSIVGLIVLIGIGVAAIFFVVNSAAEAPVKVSDQFVNAIQANEPSTAYGLTSSAFKEATPEATLTSIITRVSPLLTGEETIAGKKVQSSNGVNQASIVYTVENDSKTRYIRIVLQETDSKWEVINMKTSDSTLEAIIE